MKLFVGIAVVILSFVAPLYGQNPSTATDETIHCINAPAIEGNSSDRKVIPLAMVIAGVNAGIDCYYKQAPLGKGSLPLTKVVIDMQTVTKMSESLNLSFFVLTIKAGHTSTNTSDFAYTYQAAPPKAATSHAAKQKVPLVDSIANAIYTASQLAGAKTPNGLPLSNYVVTLSFAVDWNGSVGATAPISALTIGASVDGDKSNTQKVVLTFGMPPKG